MHKVTFRILLLLVLLIGGASVDANAGRTPSQGIIRVKLQPEAAMKVGRAPRVKAKGALLTGATPLDRAASETKAVSMRRMLPYVPRFEEQRARYGLDRWYVVEFDHSVTPEEARKIFANTAGVEKSEMIVPMSLKEGTGGFTTVSTGGKAASPSYPFNDPQLPSQWHYCNFGTLGGSVTGADINLFDAWKITTGSPDVVVAIIDGGVDFKHEDLARNMYVNQAELNGTPGVDDDGNGYVDDIYGYNFCTQSADLYPHAHGTHVAGTVAAVNNNGTGVCGVAGGNGSADSGVRMMSLQVFESRSGTGEGDFASAIVYAAENGASIAQCSWGWDAPGYYEQAVLDAIDYFTAEAKTERMNGGLCIFAAGNNGETGDYYPAAYEKALAVAAMTCELAPAPYSNNGSWVDIVAPGGLLDYGQPFGVLSTLPNNEYGYNEGTSMATPHVSGIAALILSKYGTPSFVSESLRTQLENSVNDFYGFGNNSAYRGLFGSGYIDAAKALDMSDGTAPSAVSDFTLAAAQDYVALEWDIPASADNNVHHHIIYYSTNPFTAQSDLSALKTSVADTKFLSSGEHYSHEISNLEPLTTYYFGIVAVNRWGKASAMSEVKSATTNAGPALSIESVNLDMTSTESVPVATGSFTIGNTAEGLLKWTTTPRTVSATLSSTGTRPSLIGRIAPYQGKPGFRAVASRQTVTDSYEAADYPKDLSYFTMLLAYIGDSDMSKPNSMAQWFRIDPDTYPEGFNLTDIVLTGANGRNPVIQIYKGDVAVSSATLLQEVSYDYFVYGYPVHLNEQIKFAPGESFWIVVHFEGGQEGYPLGMCVADRDDVSAYSFMSNDMGRTWTQLSTALRGSAYEQDASQMTWGITARSSNPDWSEVLEIEPASGTLRQGETSEVTVKADGSRFVNGTYQFNVNVNTNESEVKAHKVPVSLTVNGNKPDVRTPKVIDFGSLLVGESKTFTVEVYNQGYGSFRGSEYYPGLSDIQSTSEHFAGPDYVQSGFPARTKVSFEVTYSPKESGSHTGNIVFKDMNGREVRLTVRGVATDPAKVSVTPAVIDGGTLTVGAEPVKTVFTLSNQGKYPLEFVFPKFSSETIEGAGKAYHKFGYTVASTLDGFPAFAYDGNPALTGATDIASKFTDDVYVSDAVNLGFSFPYYGQNYEKVYITSFGGVMFNRNEERFSVPLVPTAYGVRGTGLICAYGRQLQMGPDSKVEYAKTDGKFVVKFTNVLALVYDQDYMPVSFHLTLSSNGDIEIFYDEYDPGNLFQQGSDLFCGINDPDVADVLTVTSADMSDIYGIEPPTPENQRFRSFGTGTAVKFEAPKPLFVRSLNVPYGMVNPGESVEITATLASDNTMNAGSTYNNLALVTNDPAPEFTAVKFNAVISGDELKPAAEFENYTVDAGEVFRTSDTRVPVALKNTGHDVLSVTSITLEKGAMTVSPSEPFTLGPGLAKDLVVTVPTDTEGDVSDVLHVSTDAGDLSATVKAKVIGCPVLELNIGSVTETVASGTPLAKDLVLTNSGNEPLVYSLTPDPLVSLTMPDNPSSTTSYVYDSSLSGNTVKYEWVDIETNGLGEQHTLSYYNMHDYVAVDLPFEFPFYGKKYSRMYVYNTGFISFTERRDDRLWPEPPADFPSGSVYTNIIAPYWGLHTMDQTKTAGTFHYVTEDRAVVSFMEYGNSMNFGVCYQAILEKDGSFTFQYKGANENAIIFGLFGLAGITDEGGTQSVRLPERMVAFGNAVRFSPVVESTIQAGESETAGLVFDTSGMAGLYETVLKVNTNMPATSTVEIPVSLTVTGEASPVWPEDITVEHTIGYMDTDYSKPLVQMGAMYTADFNVANTGTANFDIVDIAVGGPTIYDDWMGEELPVFQLFVYGPELDMWTGAPTGNHMWQPYMPGLPLTVGKTPVQFSLPMLNPEFASVPGVTEVPMAFTVQTDKGTEEHTVTVTFVVTPAPAMTLDRESIIVKADNDDDVITEKLVIGNEGEYKLTYSVRLDPSGIGEVTEEPGGGIAPWSHRTKTLSAPVRDALSAPLTLRTKPFAKSSSVYDTPNDFDYRNALYYPAMPDTRNVYNYGSNTLYDVYKAAQSFVAPEGGFNLSHLYMPVYLDGARNVDLKIEVVQGPAPDGEVVLGSGTFHIDEQPGGAFYVIPFEKSIYLNPGEEFCVIVTYPAGIKLPAYLVSKEEAVVSGRYMGWTESYGWYDVAELFEESYGSLGYIMTCLETVEGKPWISLNGDNSTGEVEVGGTAEISLEINAVSARLEKQNKAMLVIKSNDPMTPVLNYPVVLDKNGRPVIEVPGGIVYAKEGETSEVKLSVSDPDADDMEVGFQDASGVARLVSVEADAADAAEITLREDGSYLVSGASMPVTAKVEIVPAFGSASPDNAFVLSAADTKGHSTESVVRYVIEHVNRAPVIADGIDRILVKTGATSDVIGYASLFTDPDGDELTYTMHMAENATAEAYTTSTGVIFFGKKPGTAMATVTATDPEGLSTGVELEIVVSDDSGVDGVDADAADALVSVMPNPVVDNANAVCRFTAADVRFTLYDMSGALLRVVDADVTEGDTVVIPMDGAPSGVYVLCVSIGDRTIALRIVKA